MQRVRAKSLPDVATAARAGSPSAREELIGLLEPIVTKTARGIAGRGSWVAEDAAQESLLDVFHGLAGLKDPAQISAWAVKITSRRTMKVIAEEKAQGAEPLDPELFARTTSGLWSFEKIELVEAFRTLPARQRAVTYLRSTGHSVKEVAEILDCAEGTVKAAHHHGRIRLETVLRRRGLTPDRFE